jgi:leader peptidase (prepilin peptidase)/N-methyltransferase
MAVGAAGVAADPVWRTWAAGAARHRWRAEPVDPPVVLGIVTGVVAALVVLAADPAWLALPQVAVVPGTVAASAVDVRLHRLPDRIVLPSLAAVMALAVVAALGEGDSGIVTGAVAGGLIAGGFLFVIHLASPAGMGFGDVKFVTLLGLAAGTAGVPVALAGVLLGAVIGTMAGLGVMAATRDRRRAFPFGPCLAAGAVAAILAA